MSSTGRVLVAEIVRPHGVRGLVRLRGFVDNPATLTGRTLFYTAPQGPESIEVTVRQSAGDGVWLAEIKDVDNRTLAETYRQTKLYIQREDLPDAEDGVYYHVDLIGLEARDESGKRLGEVVDVVNYGASDLLEIRPDGGVTFLVPFTGDYVPEVGDGFVTLRDFEAFI